MQSKGINNAQNVQMDQGDNAIVAHTQGETFDLLSNDEWIAAPASPFTTAQYMWFSPYHSATGFNVTDNGTVQTGLQADAHGYRIGTLTPTGSGANGEQDYTVQAPYTPLGVSYVVNTAAGVAPNDTADLLSRPTLAAFDFKMEITATGPSFLQPFNAIFDLNPAISPTGDHVWAEEGDPSVTFGGGGLDYSTFFGETPAVASHVAEGFVDLLAMTGLGYAGAAAGDVFDIKLVGFAAGSPQMATFTHDRITLISGSSIG